MASIAVLLAATGDAQFFHEHRPLEVTNTRDRGDGSLRHAITHANRTGGRITFRIPGTGPHTIRPRTSLPPLFRWIEIDGTSQAGHAENLAPFGYGVMGKLVIELDGSRCVGSRTGLVLGSGCTVRGLVINRFRTGIAMLGSNSQVFGCYIGTNVGGTIPRPNTQDGILVNAGGVVIGGIQPESRNVISGNGYAGIRVRGWNCRIQGNLIGTKASGGEALPNVPYGLLIEWTGGNSTTLIGGTNPGAGNVISGNTGSGIRTYVSSRNITVSGNYIGTDASGTLDVGNGRGIHVAQSDCLVTKNTIAFNDGSGVFVGSSALRARITQNSIFSNGLLGIDLSAGFNPDGVTANDPMDPDSGGNTLQNYPVLSAARNYSLTTSVPGSLDSTPGAAFRIEFFASTSVDPTGFGEGSRYLGSQDVTTDGLGQVTFSAVFDKLLPNELWITATATDAAGNTSEFSAAAGVTNEATLVFVAHLSQNSYTVVDPDAASALSSFGFGVGPYNLAVTADGTQCWAANHDDNTVDVFDTLAFTLLARIPVGVNPNTPAFSPDGELVYVPCSASGVIEVIDRRSFTILDSIGVGIGVASVYVHPDGSEAYASVWGPAPNEYVAIVDLTTNSLTTTLPTPTPRRLAMSPDGSRVWVTNYNTPTVTVFDTASRTIVGTVPVASRPWSVAVSPDGLKAYVTSIGSSAKLSVIDTATLTVAQTLTIGGHPIDVAFSPDGSMACVMNQSWQQVQVIDTATDTLSATISVGSGPTGLCFTP